MAEPKDDTNVELASRLEDHMHDINRVRLESQFETEMSEAVPFETEQFALYRPVFGETELLELASELLEITSEAEFDRFLGDLIGHAGQAVGKLVKSPEGPAPARIRPTEA
jgi:hypothetical protein